MWLPKSVYESLPFFYVIAGLLFIAGAAYLGHWLWAAPYYLIFGYLCVVAGVVLILRRLSYRRTKAEQTLDEAESH